VEDEDDGGVGKFVSPTVVVVAVVVVVVDGLSDDACWLVDVGLERNFEMLCDDGVVGVNDLTSDDTSLFYIKIFKIYHNRYLKYHFKTFNIKGR
jgi:hypothetical protein